MSVLTPQQKKGEAQTRPSPSVSEFVKPSARHAVDDPVYDRHRQRAVIALVDGDVAGLLVRHDMLVEVAVKRAAFGIRDGGEEGRSEEHTSELQSLMRISYAVFCLQNKNTQTHKRGDT